MIYTLIVWLAYLTIVLLGGMVYFTFLMNNSSNSDSLTR